MFKHFKIYKYYYDNIMHTTLHTTTFLQNKWWLYTICYLVLDNIFNIYTWLIYIPFLTANFVYLSNVYIWSKYFMFK